MIRVLIADDHPVVRSGLERILSKEPDIKVIGEVASGHEVQELLRSHECDVIVLDISMPGMNGLDTTELLKRQKRKVAILILSVHKEELYALRAFKVGASGYLTKESAPSELINAIRTLASGGKYISPFLAEKIALELDGRQSGRTPHETLTHRELQVMRMIASGIKPKNIATDLHLSVKTVNSHRMRILEKLGAKTNAELTRYALENNLLEGTS